MTLIDNAILRLIDANMNRAIEGIRVLEDAARMIFDDHELTSELKSIRHSVTSIFSDDEDIRSRMIMARGSDRDVLRTGETSTEIKRTGLADIIRANSSRAREAIRNLEEYSKLLGSKYSGKCKEIRFRLYDAEKSLLHTTLRINNMNPDHFRLVALINPDESTDIQGISDVIMSAGIQTVIYSGDQFSDARNMLNTDVIQSRIRRTDSRLLIRDRIDIALASRSSGVVMSNDSIGPTVARVLAPPSWIIAKQVDGEDDIHLKSTAETNADFTLLRYDYSMGYDISVITDDVSSYSEMVIVESPFDEEAIADIIESGTEGIALDILGHSLDEIVAIRSFVKQIYEAADQIGNT